MRAFIVSCVIVLLGAEMALAADVEVQRCLVLVKKDVEVAAEEAGLLRAFNLDRGASIQKGTLVAQIDDQQVQKKQQVAQAELNAARKQAENTVNVDFAKASAALAQVELEKGKLARVDLARAISDAEIRRLELAYLKSNLGIKQAAVELEIAGLTADVKQAEKEAAQLDIERRKILAPLSGVVIDVFKEEGEWVQAGEPVIQIVQMDVLRVEGFVNINTVSPSDIRLKPVTVQATLTNNETVEFTGKITFVNPIVQAGGMYRVSADVNNRQVANEWLLRPGLQTIMLIHQDSPAAAAAAPVKARQR